MGTRTFTTEQLDDEIDVWCNHVSREIVEERRWYNLVELVFEYEGKHWLVTGMDPATELQEGQDRWHDDVVTATEVHQAPVTVMSWQSVPAAPDQPPAITVDQIAESLTGGDGDYHDGYEVHQSVSAAGPVVSGTYTPVSGSGSDSEDRARAVQWHAVVRLGPAPAAK